MTNGMEGKPLLLSDRRIRGSIILVLLLLAAFLFVKVVSDIKAYRYIGGGVSATNTITVEGTGEVFAVADTAEFSFSVVEEKPTVSDAQNAAAGKINAIIKYLKEQEVDEKDIKTINYSVYPRYEYERVVCTEFYCPPSGERTLKGFEVNQTISVKVRDTEKAGMLLSGVGELGTSSISGLDFTIDDEEALEREARNLAIEDAREKAAELSKALKVRLVRVVSFSESGGTPYPRYFGAVAESALGKGGDIAPEIPQGENKITSLVYITYEIR